MDIDIGDNTVIVLADGTVMAWGVYTGGAEDFALQPIPFAKVKVN